MCDFTKGFKLCTCLDKPIKFRKPEKFKNINGNVVAIKNSKNIDIPLEYIWVLFKYKGLTKEVEMGHYNFPTDNIGERLNAEWIALNLNLEHCFDFEYIPPEGDNLFIQCNVNLGPYISFIYRDKEWIIDHYSPFEVKTELVLRGRVIANE